MICPFCFKKTTSKKIVSELIPVYGMSKKQQYAYLECNMCHVVSIYPFSQSKFLEEKVYNKNYFQKTSLNILQKIIYRISFYKDYSDWVNKAISKKGKILDVGCGEGDFIRIMKSLEWEVFGVEVNKFLVKLLQKEFGKDNIKKVDESRKLVTNKFNAITFWHVVEHLDKPVEILSYYSKMLKKGGNIFIEVPNVDSLVFKIFGNKYTWLRIPDHLFYFSPESLKLLLEKSGYKDIHVWSPMKANLNLSLNIYAALDKKTPSLIQKFILIFSIPVSIIFSFFASIYLKGEVIRATAKI